MHKIFFYNYFDSFILYCSFCIRRYLNIPSEFDVTETANRLEKMLKERGMTVFARINHLDAASKVGIELRDTERMIFGNPKVKARLWNVSKVWR